jgi:hypothetical protein
MSEARLEKTETGRVLLRGPCCGLPHAEKVGGKLRIVSRHEKQRHALDLTPDELRALADEIERSGNVSVRV